MIIWHLHNIWHITSVSIVTRFLTKIYIYIFPIQTCLPSYLPTYIHTNIHTCIQTSIHPSTYLPTYPQTYIHAYEHPSIHNTYSVLEFMLILAHCVNVMILEINSTTSLKSRKHGNIQSVYNFYVCVQPHCCCSKRWIYEFVDIQILNICVVI